jgi:hypothetical protein
MLHPAFWLSVILPCWRDEARILHLLEAFKGSGGVEWVVVHADASPSFPLEAGARGAVAVEVPKPSRGGQLRAGAQAAQAETLLFHHADSHLTPAHLHALRSLTAEPGWIWGAFYRKFDERHPALRRFEAIERWHNRRFGAVYGDQSLFMRREAYHHHGGFQELPLMEDVEFSLRLRRSAPPRMIDPPMASSPRKHLAQGPWRTTVGNLLALWAFRLGVPPARLHAWYYHKTTPLRNKPLLQPSLQKP